VTEPTHPIVTPPPCLPTWAGVEDVAVFLGVDPAGAADDEWLQRATDAANSLAYRRRWAAGYVDLCDVSPSEAVTAGVVLYAANLYRQRGAVDGFASFQELGAYQPTGATWGEIMRLLGIGKPAVA
jgi:hypothetical protein